MKRNIIPLVSFVMLSLSLISCDESVTPTGTSVTGQVVYDIGVASGVTVSIGNQVTQTDNEGKFTFDNVSIPYDVIIIYNNNAFADIYIGVSSTSPVINIGENSFAPESNKASILPHFPIAPKSQGDMRFFFKPDDNNPIIYYPYLTDQRLDVYWESGIETLNGKFIVLYENFLQHSYYWYAEKDSISLRDMMNMDIFIDSTDLMLDPGERIISASIQSPLGSTLQLGYYQSFTGYKPLGYEYFPIGFSANNSFSITVPDNLPIPFSNYIFIQQYSSEGDAQGIFKYNEGGNNNFQFHSSPYIIYPAENDSTQLYYSDFSWTAVEGNGIYKATLVASSGPTKVMNVFTASPNFRIPDLSYLQFDPFRYSNDYKWTVRKYFNFSGMDDFVFKNFTHNENYTSESGEVTNYTNIKLY